VKSKLTQRNLNWNRAPKNFVLTNNEVHVWVADLETVAKEREFAKLLSPDELERAKRFHFESDRRNFIAARGLLRTFLADYTKTSAANLQFSYSPNGKPSLAFAAQFGNLQFNLSHSDGVAIYAFAQNHKLGIDIESLRPFAEMHEVAGRCFSAHEQSTLRTLSSPKQEEKFFRYWTRKEAVLKCTGEGFSDERDRIGEADFAGTVLELNPADCFIATLAVLGKPFVLKTWQFS
jgi:4'-phosphopantetheinyl transferase